MYNFSCYNFVDMCLRHIEGNKTAWIKKNYCLSILVTKTTFILLIFPSLFLCYVVYKSLGKKYSLTDIDLYLPMLLSVSVKHPFRIC